MQSSQKNQGGYWSNLGKRMSRNKFVYLIVAPALLLTLIFSYLPMGGLIMAFQDYDIIGGMAKSPWVGFDNFIKIFTIPKFTAAIKNTIVYSAVGIIGGTPLPILLALLFNELKAKNFKKLVQTVSYLPYFLSWVSVIGMFYGMFATGGSYNDFMAAIVGEGYERTNILTNPDNFLGVIFWSNQWKNVGWSSIVYLAAITSIDPCLYEAAVVDGCNRFKQAIHITLPGILPTIAILFIMSMASLVVSNFEQVYGFQNIYTQEQTEVINTLVYRQGILNGDYSLSTAFGIAQGLVSFVLVFVSNWIIKRGTGVGIW